MRTRRFPKAGQSSFKPAKPFSLISPSRQIQYWKKAAKAYQISFYDTNIPEYPKLTKKDISDGFTTRALFFTYGNRKKPSSADLVRTMIVSWKLLQDGYLTWTNSNIFDDNKFTLTITRAEHRSSGFYWKKINFGKAWQGRSVADIDHDLSSEVCLATGELLQLLAVDSNFLSAMDGDLLPFYDLGDCRLMENSKEGLVRSLCIYTVGKYLVLDRSSIEYTRGWNSCLLLK